MPWVEVILIFVILFFVLVLPILVLGRRSRRFKNMSPLNEAHKF